MALHPFFACLLLWSCHPLVDKTPLYDLLSTACMHDRFYSLSVRQPGVDTQCKAPEIQQATENTVLAPVVQLGTATGNSAPRAPPPIRMVCHQ